MRRSTFKFKYNLLSSLIVLFWFLRHRGERKLNINGITANRDSPRTTFRLGSAVLKADPDPAEALRELLTHSLQRGNHLKEENQNLKEENLKMRGEHQRISAE
ncbi:DNA repair protein XRCC4 [Dissostichus eleginoides]|nr:DNA repair protein XRCC4 [Dissostichus eleginoides]